METVRLLLLHAAIFAGVFAVELVALAVRALWLARAAAGVSRRMVGPSRQADVGQRGPSPRLDDG